MSLSGIRTLTIYAVPPNGVVLIPDSPPTTTVRFPAGATESSYILNAGLPAGKYIAEKIVGGCRVIRLFELEEFGPPRVRFK